MMRRVDGLPMVALSCGEFAVAFLVQKGWRDQDIYERKTPIMKGAEPSDTTTSFSSVSCTLFTYTNFYPVGAKAQRAG